MSEKNIQVSMQHDVAKIAGANLHKIVVGMFIVEFHFLSTSTFILRVKKEFNFWLSSGEERRFIADASIHDYLKESTEFVLLHGMSCQNASINSTCFRINLNGGAALWIEYGPDDFEPIEFIGSSGDRHQNLDFYYVI